MAGLSQTDGHVSASEEEVLPLYISAVLACRKLYFDGTIVGAICQNQLAEMSEMFGRSHLSLVNQPVEPD